MNDPTQPLGPDPTAIDGGSLAALLAIFAVVLVIAVVLGVLSIIAVWRVNLKAGQPGWAAIIPVYGTVVLLRIGGRPPSWAALLAVPLLCAVIEQANPEMLLTDPGTVYLLTLLSLAISLVLSILTGTGLAKAFGRSTAFGIWGLGVFAVIGYCVLGFGREQHYFAPPPPPVWTAPPSAGGPAGWQQ